jgi:hypothetical protein
MSALASLGVYAGSPEDLATGDQHNPEGYWENHKIWEQIVGALAVFDLHRDATRSLPENWRDHPQSGALIARFAAAMTSCFQGRQLWGWKDPSATLVLPIVRQVFDDLKLRPRYLLAVRHPLDVARSMNARDSVISIPSSLGIWLHYNLTALHDLPCEDTYVSFYRDLLDNPRAALTPVMSGLALPFPSDAQWDVLQEEAVRSDLAHSRTPIEELEFAKPRLMARTFAILREIRDDLDGYHSSAYREKIEALWHEWKTWEEVRSFVRPASNAMTFNWRQMDGTPRGIAYLYSANFAWNPLAQSLDAPPRAYVGVNLGNMPGVMYLRHLILSTQDGRTERVQLHGGQTGHLSEIGGGVARAVFCGPGLHASFRMPGSPGPWQLRAEFFPDFSRSAVAEATMMLANELQRSRSTRA